MRTRQSVAVEDIRASRSILGPGWNALYTAPAQVSADHFSAAMQNLVRNPHINSSTLLRADILDSKHPYIDSTWLSHNIDDLNPRVPVLEGWNTSSVIVRCCVPRNPQRDAVVNQTCVFYTLDDLNSVAVSFVPHINSIEECPFYLPKARAVALVFDSMKQQVSVHFQLWGNTQPLIQRDPNDRLVRIGFHLVQAAVKHSIGLRDGYSKRVHHDVIVDRVTVQNTYLRLKQKYASVLTSQWTEKTDPTKHVFEDLGIAAFLIELWHQMWPNPDAFEFLDLGCGNGLLVHILASEGFRGRGVDVRGRKSWANYPPETHLETRIVVPEVLGVAEEPGFEIVGPCVDKNLFLIGNHSDELTLWLPLLGCPFMVLPCCSHRLSGERARFAVPAGSGDKSAYAGLVAKTIDLATKAGWHVEKEMLRIPSTRNAAVIGRHRNFIGDVASIVSEEGGALEWVANARKLASSAGSSHE